MKVIMRETAAVYEHVFDKGREYEVNAAEYAMLSASGSIVELPEVKAEVKAEVKQTVQKGKKK